MSPPPPTTARARRRSGDYSKPLTREKIAAAAIEIVRDEGQAALSMRKVAGRFGVDVAALYRHFRNKDALLGHVGQLASELVELDAPTEGSWDERMLALATSVRARIAEHPELGIYGGGSAWATPFIARANGRIAELFHEAGLEGERLVLATQTMLHVVTSIAQSEVMTRSGTRAQNRAFAETILAEMPESTRGAWPAARAQDTWSLDFEAFFDFAVRSTLDSLAPTPR